MIMSTSAFFSSDDAISRKIDCNQINTANDEIDRVYYVKECVQWILANKFVSVALQFPDDLLTDAPLVAACIQEQLPLVSVFILGDTSYGSCCVDEVGAAHYKADCVIHYGPACLSLTVRLPVFYVLGKSHLDVDDCVSKICQQSEDTALKAILTYDTKYAHIVGKVFHQLRNRLPNLVLSKVSLPHSGIHNQGSIYESMYPHCSYVSQGSETETCTTVKRCGRVISLLEEENIDSYSFLFLGNPNSPSIMNMMINFNKSPFYAYDPETSLYERITLNVNKTLMKRYYLIERAKDANIVGILAGTLGVDKYCDMINHLKLLLKKAGKKSYTFVVGKLNPQKLANFAEVELYVLVSCPESCLFDQSDFHCPVVTPFEMEIACNKAREWTGDYVTDFSTLLPGASMYTKAPETCLEEEGDVSLISNRIRVLGERTRPELSSSRDVIAHSQALVAENAGEFLAMRTWQGLEQNLGKTAVVKAVEGQTGIAASYTNEQPQ